MTQAKLARLVLYLGAGVSRAAPTNGPMGNDVANRLRYAAAEMLGCREDELNKDTLEELASKVDSLENDAMSRLRSLAASAYDFAGAEPNYGHRAVAMLMREGLVKTISANWDCAVERAGLQIGVTIVGVTSVMQAQGLTTELPLYKVHGCAKTPSTLKITAPEVNDPQGWAIAEVQASLTSGTVVFTGLATVGDYVSDPITQILETWSGYAGSIRIAAPVMPTSWATVLGGEADSSHFALFADDFFDELLRAVALDGLAHVVARAHILADLEAWAQPMASGSDLLQSAFLQAPAHLVLGWWRDGVAGTQAGRPFITDVAGQNALMAVGLIAGRDGSVEAVGRGGRFAVRTPVQYVEVISRPGAHLSDVTPVAVDRATRRWDDGAYADALPITFVVVGAVGTFPACDAVGDIAGSDDFENDIGGDMLPLIRYTSAEDAIQGRLG